MAAGGYDMTFPILVTQANGKFTASVLGAPQVTAEGATKEQAVEAVTTRLRDAVASRELVLVDVPSLAPVPLRLRTPEEIEDWQEVCKEIYRERDAQKAAEWPE
jgi:hypothetical protein